MIKVLATGSKLPETVVTNFDLENMVDTSDEWITKMTGIKQRHVLQPGESILDLIEVAAKDAITKSNLEADTIDLIIIGTSTPDQSMPSSASIIQGRLGIKNAIAFDMQAACSGFVYAAITAYNFMQQDSGIRNALVIGSETLSRAMNWDDRRTCVLFGDGCGAVVLGRDQDDSSGVLAYDIGSDGAGCEELGIRWGIGQGYDVISEQNKYLYMNGREVFKRSTAYFRKSIEHVVQKANLSLDDIDWIVPHQANDRILQAVAEKLNIDSNKLVSTISEHGNTSAASIPMAYDHMCCEGKIKPGQLVMFSAFGAGFTWASMLFRV